MVNGGYVFLTINGVTGSHQHYSYQKRVAKGNTQIELQIGDDILELPGYLLDESQGDSRYVVPDQDKTLTFHYKRIYTFRVVGGGYIEEVISAGQSQSVTPGQTQATVMQGDQIKVKTLPVST